jgi:uncharacterized membrane protein
METNAKPAHGLRRHFGKGRFEAFSDGVFAIIITIMVLELKVPHEANPHALLELGPTFLGYVLSFLYVGIYWNNHHHLIHVAKHVDGRAMWANLHLLFWLSLLPFVTAYSTENHYAPLTIALYGSVLLMAAVAYTLLVFALRAAHPADAAIHRAIGGDRKGKISLALYTLGIGLGYWVSPWWGEACFVVVALVWLIPDRRIERALHEEGAS